MWGSEVLVVDSILGFDSTFGVSILFPVRLVNWPSFNLRFSKSFTSHFCFIAAFVAAVVGGTAALVVVVVLL